MPRTFYIQGQTMVSVTGPAGSLIAAGNQLGLAADAIQVTVQIHSDPLIVDAYGKNNPVDEQVFGSTAVITMNLIHFNPAILDECIRLSVPPSVVEGQLGQAGWRRGVALPLGTAGNSFITLNIGSPPNLNNALSQAWNFPATYLRDDPIRWPLGAEKSIVTLTWRALAYAIDPWGGGTGSLGVPLYNRTNISTTSVDAP